MNNISIIIFANNEEKLIYDAVFEIIETIDKFDFLYEIIIINDGSKDKTINEIKKLELNYPKIIKILDNLTKEGIAKSVKKGLEIASFDKVLWLPGDGAYEPISLKNIMINNENYDLIIGYRNNKSERKFKRFFLSYILSVILNMIFFENIKDYNGTIIFNKKDFELIYFPEHPSFQWVILIQLLKLKKKYIQKPVNMKIPEPGNTSTSINFKTFFSYFFSLINLIRRVFFNNNDK